MLFGMNYLLQSLLVPVTYVVIGIPYSRKLLSLGFCPSSLNPYVAESEMTKTEGKVSLLHTLWQNQWFD